MTRNRDSSIEDLNKTVEFNPFSEKSKELITDMGNTEYCELCEISLAKYSFCCFWDDSHQRDARHSHHREDRRDAETAQCVCTTLCYLSFQLENQTSYLLSETKLSTTQCPFSEPHVQQSLLRAVSKVNPGTLQLRRRAMLILRLGKGSEVQKGTLWNPLGIGHEVGTPSWPKRSRNWRSSSVEIDGSEAVTPVSRTRRTYILWFWWAWLYLEIKQSDSISILQELPRTPRTRTQSHEWGITFGKIHWKRKWTLFDRVGAIPHRGNSCDAVQNSDGSSVPYDRSHSYGRQGVEWSSCLQILRIIRRFQETIPRL